MAFPLPTRVTDELIDATIWNSDLVANLNILPRPIVKTDPQVVTGSTTLVDDNHLFFPVGTNQFYLVEGALWHEASTTGHFRFTFTGPTGYDGHITAFGVDTGGSAFNLTYNIRDAAEQIQFFSGTTGVITWYKGVFSTAGTAGNFRLRWAQSAATGTTTLKKGSYMLYARTIG